MTDRIVPYDKPVFYPLVWVEGVIGSGKTSFCRKIGPRLKMRIIEEPVNDNPYLELFYRDKQAMKKYSFAMQIWLAMRRAIIQQLAAHEASGVGGYQGAMIDRSISGDRVFAKLLWKAKCISDLDWQTYNQIHAYVARTLLPPTLIVYLDVQPETAFERVKKRARAAEVKQKGGGVSLDYLRALHEGYRELLDEAEAGLLPWAHAVRVVRVPWDVDTVTPRQWARTAKTIREACKMVRS